MAFVLSTTGTQNPVVFNDIGGRTFAHPTVSFDLETEFSPEEIAESDDIQDAITNGWITVVDANGEPINNVADATSALPLATQAEAEAASSTDRRAWTPQRVGEAVAANAVPSIPPLTEAAPDEAADFLVYYDVSTSDYKKVKFDGIPGFSDLPGIQVRRSTNFAIPTSFADIVFDTTDVENDTSVLELNGANADRIDAKDTGLYMVSYQCSVDADAGEETMTMRVRINDTTVIPGSLRTISEDDEINDIGNVFLVELTAGDFLTFQIEAAGTGNVLQADSTYTITRLRGTKGEKGDTGSGSTITVEVEDNPVAGGPHSILNFIGNGVSGADAGSGQADLTFKHLFNLGVGRNNANATNEWLRDANGLPTNLSPIRVPFACRIIAITGTGNAVQTWDAEVYDGVIARAGGTPSDASKLTEIQISSANSGQVTGLAVDLTAGQEIGIFLRGTSIDYPRVTLWLERTD